MRSATLFAACLLSVPAVARGDDPKPAPARFDMTVREDIFAGFRGDAEALERGIKACDEALKANPKHAEAMVWRGAALVNKSGQLFRQGKQAEALPLWQTGLKAMDEAVALEPENIGVRIPRAAVLMAAGHNAPPAMGKPLIEKALGDLKKTAEKQKDTLVTIGTHPLGELRMGMADAYRFLGQADQSKAELEAVIKELPDSKYAARAKEWLAAKAEVKLVHNCIGCHTAK